MATIGEPIKHDITIYQGTDHEWVFRRISQDGTPVIPDNAYAEIRDMPNGKLWSTLVCDIDLTDGWIYVRMDRDETAAKEWYTRENGAWDLFVFIDNQYYKWVMGSVVVSQKVTQNVGSD